MAHYIAYYSDQVGGGSRSLEYSNGHIITNRRRNFQRGSGVGAVLGGLYRQIYPLLSKSMKPVGKELLTAGANVLSDVLTRNQDLKKSLQNRLTESGHRLKRKAVDKVEEMLRQHGSGYKAKRRRKTSQKGKGLRSVRTSSKKRKPKVRRRTVKKRAVKKPTKKRVTKKKTRSVYDVLGSI